MTKIPKQLERIRLTFSAKGNVDIENRVIRDAILCQVGKAKGHGIEANLRCLEKLLKLAPKGVDSYWGHNWDNQGMWLGKYEALKVVDDKQLVGDLHVDEIADQSPNFAQPVGKYLLNLVKKDPTKAMGSIVCVIEKYYQIDANGNDVRVWYYDENWDWIRANDKMPVFFEPKTFESCDVVDKGALTDAMFREKKDLNAVLDGHAIHQFIQNMENEALATDVATPDDASLLAQVKKLLFGKKEEVKVEMADANTHHVTTKALQNKIEALTAEKVQLSTDKTHLQTQLTAAQNEIAQLQKEKADLEALNVELGKTAPKLGEVKANVGDAAVTTLASHPAQIKFIAHLQNIQ